MNGHDEVRSVDFSGIRAPRIRVTHLAQVNDPGSGLPIGSAVRIAMDDGEHIIEMIYPETLFLSSLERWRAVALGPTIEKVPA